MESQSIVEIKRVYNGYKNVCSSQKYFESLSDKGSTIPKHVICEFIVIIVFNFNLL